MRKLQKHKTGRYTIKGPVEYKILFENGTACSLLLLLAKREQPSRWETCSLAADNSNHGLMTLTFSRQCVQDSSSKTFRCDPSAMLLPLKSLQWNKSSKSKSSVTSSPPPHPVTSFGSSRLGEQVGLLGLDYRRNIYTSATRFFPLSFSISLSLFPVHVNIFIYIRSDFCCRLIPKWKVCIWQPRV